MTPTQAQIEAAVRKVMTEENTAIVPKNRDYLVSRLIEEITAAAQVAEDKSAYVEALNFAHAHERGSKEATAATIERCAQVVDDFGKNADGGWTNRILQDCSAAIRKLKDAP